MGQFCCRMWTNQFRPGCLGVIKRDLVVSAATVGLYEQLAATKSAVQSECLSALQ